MLTSSTGSRRCQGTFQSYSLFGAAERILEYTCVVLVLFYPFYAFFDLYFGLDNITYLPFLIAVSFLLILSRVLYTKFSFISVFDYLILLYALLIMFLPILSFKGEFRSIIGVFVRENVLFFLTYLAVSRTSFIRLYTVLQKCKTIVIGLVLLVGIITVYYLRLQSYYQELRLGGGMVLVISDLIAVYLIMDFSVNKRFSRLSFLLLFGLLLLLNSLASILSASIALSVYWTLNHKLTIRKVLTFTILLFAVSLTILVLTMLSPNSFDEQSFKDNAVLAPVNRLVIVLTNPYQDRSYVGRSYFHQLGLEIIRTSPLIGEYLYQYRLYGYRYGNLTGGYMHNILSVWAEYGFIAFIFLLLSLVAMCVFAVKQQLSSSIFLRSSQAVIFFAVTNLALFRTYSWYWLPFVLGFCTSYYRWIRRREYERNLSSCI